jgi:hypothetical protein
MSRSGWLRRDLELEGVGRTRRGNLDRRGTRPIRQSNSITVQQPDGPLDDQSAIELVDGLEPVELIGQALPASSASELMAARMAIAAARNRPTINSEN